MKCERVVLLAYKMFHTLDFKYIRLVEINEWCKPLCKTHRYEMRLCWCMDPQERPKFQSLVMSLSRLLESESGYLDLSNSLLEGYL